jgi:TPR repeat protein
VTLLVPVLLLVVFLGQLALPRVGANPLLFASVAGAGGLMLLWQLALAGRGKRLGLEFTIKRAHVGQMCVHTSVYAYWGLHWPDVFAQAPLILGQVCFLSLLEILGSWSLNRRHRLGLGAVPIVFSTNLFLWFHDDWFYLQYGMLVISWLTKEFVKWDRGGGQKVHVFNPSAISLALAGVVLIGLGRTDIARAQEISQALGIGPWCFESIFLAGLIIMSIVPVAAMTAASALTMLGLGFLWTQATGTYHFIDTAIPIAVFLGMNLLATDPVTTPRGPLGKLIAGVIYGVSVFFLYDLLKHFGQPATETTPAVTVTYFDKLLFVPVLNLLAPVLDRLAAALARGRSGPGWLRNNYVHMALWAGAFVFLVRPNTREHPGRQAETWRPACEAGQADACGRLGDLLVRDCGAGEAAACHNAAIHLEKTADTLRVADLYGRACAGGIAAACEALGTRILAGQVAGQGEAEAGTLFAQACDGGRAPACHRAALLFAPADPTRARTLAERACASDHLPGCAALGILVLQGQGGPRDPAAAAPLLERACEGSQAAACANLAVMYRRGDGVAADPARAEALRQKACDAGLTAACQWERP